MSERHASGRTVVAERPLAAVTTTTDGGKTPMSGDERSGKAASPAGGGAPVSAEGEVGLVTQVAQLLAEPVRLRILCELLATPRNVTELQASLSVPQPTVSHHLALLRSGQLVTRRRAGRKAIYALGPRARADGDSLVISAGPLRVDWRVRCD